MRLPYLAALTSLASLASAQSITPIVLEGDPVPGIGTVTRIENIAVNNAGEWLIEVDTDGANADTDGALLGTSSAVFQEGQSLPLPAGSQLDGFDSIRLNNNGNASYNHFLDGTTGTSDDSGVYWNDSLLIQESQITTAAGLSAGTPYIGFFETVTNDSETVVAMASMDDPAITTSVDRVIMVLTTDGAGNLVSETVFAKEGDLFGSGNLPATDFGTGPSELDLNDLGQIMFAVDMGTDAAIYIDGTMLAEEGGASPVGGRLWSTLTSTELGLNNSGDWVFSGSLDGDSTSNLLIERNGAKFRQEGDSLPAIAPFTLTSFGSGPLDIADNGKVLWYGDWDDTNTDVDTGLFLDDTLLVQEGITVLNGAVVDALRGIQDGYAISDNGRYVIFEAQLVGGVEGAFLIDLGGPGTPYCFGDGGGTPCPCGNTGGTGEGCANSSGAGGVLSSLGSASVGADDLQLVASGLLPNQPALLFVGTTQPGAGLGLAFGDGLRCAGGTVIRLGVSVPGANGTTSWGAGLAGQGGWDSGDVRHFQAWYRDPSGSPCGSAFNLSSALTVVFQM